MYTLKVKLNNFKFSRLFLIFPPFFSFQDFAVGLSILIRGSLEEKLRWTFSLYDQDRDGFISREEMEDVVGSVFDLMGRTGDPAAEEDIINERVGFIFEVRHKTSLKEVMLEDRALFVCGWVGV